MEQQNNAQTTNVSTKPTKTPEQQQAEHEAKRNAKALARLAAFPQADASTLTWDSTAGKLKVQLTCATCGSLRWVFTSDLFQVRLCETCTEAERKARKKARKEAAKATAKQSEVY